MRKAFWKSKTLWFQVATLALGIFTVVAQSELVPANVVLVIATTIIPAINFALRLLTTEPVALRGSK